MMTLADLIPTLQLAIGPVILISGIGLLLLSMTNRFGRVIDRTRHLAREFHGAEGADSERILGQLRILAKRATLVRSAISLASVSVLLAAVLIISLFLGALFNLGVVGWIVALFISCLTCLIWSLLLFICDINLSLKALWLEMPPEGRDKP